MELEGDGVREDGGGEELALARERLRREKRGARAHVGATLPVDVQIWLTAAASPADLLGAAASAAADRRHACATKKEMGVRRRLNNVLR